MSDDPAGVLPNPLAMHPRTGDALDRNGSKAIPEQMFVLDGHLADVYIGTMGAELRPDNR